MCAHVHNLEELGAGGELLANHASHRDHREAAVVELLGLHLLELGVVRRLEAWARTHDPFARERRTRADVGCIGLRSTQ